MSEILGAIYIFMLFTSIVLHYIIERMNRKIAKIMDETLKSMRSEREMYEALSTLNREKVLWSLQQMQEK